MLGERDNFQFCDIFKLHMLVKKGFWTFGLKCSLLLFGIVNQQEIKVKYYSELVLFLYVCYKGLLFCYSMFTLFQDEKSKSSQDGDTYKWAGIEAVMQSYLMHAAGELCKSCNVESLFPVHSTLIHSRPANLSILSMTHCTHNLFNDF